MKSSWQRNFETWQEFARNLSTRAAAADKMAADRAWELAKSVGIPRCGCSLHNAAIDDSMTGWCHQNPERLRVAKRANYMLANSFKASAIAERIINRAYQRMVKE